MKLSIITIHYNQIEGLRKTLESVWNQSVQDFEFLVIDGGSTDGSVAFLREQEARLTYWCSEPDGGIYPAMNKGIAKARGTYLMFLNAGDCLSDASVIKTCLEQIEAHPTVDVFYGDMYGFQGDVTQKWLHTHPATLDLLFLETQNLNHQSSLFRAELFRELGPYPASYPLAGDHWLFLRSFLADKVFHHISYPLVVFDYGGVGSRSREQYVREMAALWQELVPAYVRKLMPEYRSLKHQTSRGFIRTAIRLYQTFHRQKK